jgi:eukaryotic-like serine/threonine-protein kinase
VHESRRTRAAKELFTKAYSLRKHASERERFYIESMYYERASGELESATRVFREWLNSYPRDAAALNNLALTYDSMGQYQQAFDLAREELRQEPNNVVAYLAHAWTLISFDRFAAMQGDTVKAKAAYQDFLTLWKDADPDILILKQAKAEYAKLN